MTQGPGSYDRFHDSSIEQPYNAFLHTIADPLQIDAAELAELKRTDAGHWITWSFAVLGGDTQPRLIHKPGFERRFPSQKAQDLLCASLNTNVVQTYDLTQGQLGVRFSELVAAKDRTAIHQINQACAEMVFDLTTLVKDRKPSYAAELAHVVPQTLLGNVANEGAAIQFSNQRIPGCLSTVITGGTMPRVATCGPGLSGEAFATSAIAAGTRELHFVSGGPGAEFVNGMISRALCATQVSIEDNKRHNPDILRQHFPHMPVETISTPTAHYYHQGIGAGVEQLARNLKGERLNAFVMSAVHHAGRVECLAGAQAAPDLLAPDGLCILKLPKKAIGEFAGYDTVEPTLRRAFGEPEFIEQSLLDLESPPGRGVTYPLPAIHAVYKK